MQAGGYGLVLISSWQSVVATLIRDENDNAGAVRVMEAVKTAARETGIPWLIDAHSGKGEDQSDDADPTRALRGASGAAGAADFILSLRYADTPFSTRRRLSGKGRFVSVAPILMEFDAETGAYIALGDTKTATAETTWRLIHETQALTMTPQGATSIAVRAGLAPDARSVSGAIRRQIDTALRKRPGVRVIKESRGDRTLRSTHSLRSRVLMSRAVAPVAPDCPDSTGATSSERACISAAAPLPPSPRCLYRQRCGQRAYAYRQPALAVWEAPPVASIALCG